MASMMLPMSSSSVMPTLPTATPMHNTFFSWNLMVDLTSVTLVFRSSACEIGAGNLPAGSLQVGQPVIAYCSALNGVEEYLLKARVLRGGEFA